MTTSFTNRMVARALGGAALLVLAAETLLSNRLSRRSLEQHATGVS